MKPTAVGDCHLFLSDADRQGATSEASLRWEELERDVFGFKPLSSKLRPPRPQLELVSRRSLVNALLRSAKPLVLVSAPAGAGKTTVLTQWVEEDARPTAWLSLDSRDNDPVVLLRYVALALENVAAIDETILDLLQLRRPPVQERILPSLAAAIRETSPFLFVLDDAQLVDEESCWDALAALVGNLPAGAQLAIGTRADPPLPLARLRGEGRLAELHMGDLALDRGEAQQLLDLRGSALDDEHLDALLTITEGWAIGLSLAILAGEGRSPDEWLPRLSGDQQAIAEYLTSEVVERQAKDMRDFLLSTAILDSLSPALCRTVTGRRDAHLLLARLVHENLFVVTLDDRAEWFRYHHLFADVLRRILTRSEPRRLRRLHRRAATWHRDNGDPERAVRHWLAAGDAVQAAALASVACMYYLEKGGQIESARLLLKAFSDGQIKANVNLTLTAGWVLGASAGDPEERRWAELACRVETGDELWPDGTVSLRAIQALLRAMLAPDGVHRMREDAKLAAKLVTSLGTSSYSTSRLALGWSAYLSGSPKRASPHFLSVAEHYDGEDGAQAMGSLSLIAADQGDWERAEEFARRGYALVAGQVFCSPADATNLAILLARARVLSHKDHPEAGEWLQRTSGFVEDMWGRDQWVILYASVVLGEVAQEQGDLALAEAHTRRALRTLAAYPDVGILGPRARRLRRNLDSRLSSEAISAAERRVLELLPTYLTPEQIAERLFLSKNTVRSHIRALYRKLEVGSRGEAVQRAYDRGLLKRV